MSGKGIPDSIFLNGTPFEFATFNSVTFHAKLSTLFKNSIRDAHTPQPKEIFLTP